ncbi:MAG TPA: glycosyltransferase [Candidatus Dormibacteraeota bacterium]|nr:glycosyltransferase [Candidatus Dormibacteraeota bacterium]
MSGPTRPSRAPAAIAVVSVHASPVGRLGHGENGGMNLAILRLCQELSVQGVPTDVFVRREDPAEPAERLLAPGSRLVLLEAGPARPLPKADLLGYLPAFSSALLAHAASEERTYRLVHGHYWLSGWVAKRVCTRWRVPWVQSFHTLARLKEQAGLPADPQRAAVEEVLARGADRLVALSPAEGRALVDLYGASHDAICVVPPGVDVDRFAPRPITPLRARHGTAGRRVIVSAARLERLKGVDLLIEAVADLRARGGFDDVLVLCAGADSRDGSTQSQHPGGERGRLEELAVRLGVGDHVRFLGPVDPDELADLYAIADVVAVPSMTETFGFVALEAQASGTPVVACAVGGLVETVADGITGRLVEGRDPAAFAAALADVLSDGPRRRRMGDAARERALERGWDRAADRLLSLYACVEEPAARSLEACACV